MRELKREQQEIIDVPDTGDSNLLKLSFCLIDLSSNKRFKIWILFTLKSNYYLNLMIKNNPYKICDINISCEM